MASDTEMSEALVLSDASGNLYVIPRETLEKYRATDDQKAEIEQILDEDDVLGFAQTSPGSAHSVAPPSTNDVLTGSFFNIPPISRAEGGRSKS